MGRECTEQEYVQADAVYLQVGLNKQEFCRDWKIAGGTDLVKELSDEFSEADRQIQKLAKRIKTLHNAINKSPRIEELIIRTVSGGVTSWACVNPNEGTFEFMDDEEDEDSYVSGGFALDDGDVEGVFVSEEFHGNMSVTDYDGCYQLPPLVKRAFEILGYDTSEL